MRNLILQETTGDERKGKGKRVMGYEGFPF